MLTSHKTTLFLKLITSFKAGLFFLPIRCGVFFCQMTSTRCQKQRQTEGHNASLCGRRDLRILLKLSRHVKYSTSAIIRICQFGTKSYIITASNVTISGTQTVFASTTFWQVRDDGDDDASTLTHVHVIGYLRTRTLYPCVFESHVGKEWTSGGLWR